MKHICTNSFLPSLCDKQGVEIFPDLMDTLYVTNSETRFYEYKSRILMSVPVMNEQVWESSLWSQYCGIDAKVGISLFSKYAVPQL